MGKDVEEYSLNAANLELLLNNEIQVIRIKHFATSAEAEELAFQLLAHAKRTHSVKTITRLGISYYEQGIVDGKGNYFGLVEECNQTLETLTRTSFHPVRRLINLLSQYIPDVGVMSEPGYGDYFAGVGKLREGYTPVHIDFGPRDAPDWGIGEVTAQLAWNCYLRIPATGGLLKVWNKSWNPQDEAFAVEDTYYHSESVVENSEYRLYQPTVGDVLLLNSRNFHTVTPCQDRIAFGSFIGLMPNGALRFWS